MIDIFEIIMESVTEKDVVVSTANLPFKHYKNAVKYIIDRINHYKTHSDYLDDIAFLNNKWEVQFASCTVKYKIVTKKFHDND